MATNDDGTPVETLTGEQIHLMTQELGRNMARLMEVLVKYTAFLEGHTRVVEALVEEMRRGRGDVEDGDSWKNGLGG